MLFGLQSHLESFQFQGFSETILTPLQASTVLFRADQRRAAQTPPLPPVSKEQISNGELKDLLEESNYDLTTKVNIYFILTTSSIQYNSIMVLITNNSVSVATFTVIFIWHKLSNQIYLLRFEYRKLICIYFYILYKV